MIKTFRNAGLEAFFKTGSKAGIQPQHAPKLGNQLATLNRAANPGDMNRPGWRFHPLQGNLKGHYAVNVSGNWRMTFAFANGDAVLVDYQDYH